MKNRTLLISSFLALVLLAIVVMSFSACDFDKIKTADQQKLAESCIRIHIRANSNGDCDQAVKLRVRDRITEYLENVLVDCKSKSEAKSVLTGASTTLVNIANSTLSSNGFEYKSTIRFSNEYFPDRIYDGYEFPAGYYDALVINLGTGAGDNWWCVAFPPLCFVPDSNGDEQVVYKSYIKEILDKIFN